jgi:hypothetical protein
MSELIRESLLTCGSLVDDLGDPPEGDARAEEGQAACKHNITQTGDHRKFTAAFSS